MAERFIFYASSGLVLALVCWIGVAAVFQALRRFGVTIKFPLWPIFIALWLITTGTGFLFGQSSSDNTGLAAVAVLGIGILVWLISLLFGRKSGKQSAR